MTSYDPPAPENFPEDDPYETGEPVELRRENGENMTLCSPETERNVIGAVLWAGELFEKAKLKSEDFSIHRYRHVWEAFEEIRAKNDFIDIHSVERELRKAGHWEDVNVREPLAGICNPTTLHLEVDAFEVHDLARRRRLLDNFSKRSQIIANRDIPLPPEPGDGKGLWTQAELAKAEFPEPAGPIPGLIPNGLTVLGGRPKRGKSWLMLQAGCAVALGGKFLDKDLRQGKVRYYALEDRPKRLKERTARLGIPPEAEIEYVLSVEPLYLGGLAEIERAARSGEYAMIIIDTIRRVMPGKDFNKDGALFDDVLGKLQTLAGQNQLAIVCILHTRKASFGVDPDPVDDVLGSTGLTASADCVYALYTEQGKKGATLKGRGRDMDDVDLALTFDPLTNCWQSLGDSSEAKDTQLGEDILSVLEEVGKATIATISKTINKDFSNTRRKLISLWVGGKARREEIDGKMYYYLASKAREMKEVMTNETNDQ